MSKQEIFIFTGPTLSPKQGANYLQATYLPPVKYGDVYRIVELYQPKIIGIIDGYFNQVPAVWHKEILWAIDQGITVYGSASMGALRAAELDQMDMIGVGKIYQAYKMGVLVPFIDEDFEDDDEVAVVHAPAELGYLAASDAMVNIRCSLAKAAQSGVIDKALCMALSTIAKSTFYADRTYQSLLKSAEKHPALLSTAISQKPIKLILVQLKKWLETNAVNQKQLDAIEMLELINRCKAKPSVKIDTLKPIFQHTMQWQTAIEECDRLFKVDNKALNELRLKGTKYFQALGFALDHAFGLNSESQNEDLTKLHSKPEALQKILSTQLRQKQISALKNDVSTLYIEQAIILYLTQSNQFEKLQIRADHKRNKLAQLKSKPSMLDLDELEKLQLCDWYFTSQLDKDMPVKLEKYSQSIGIDHLDFFYAMILDEYLYLEEA